MLTRRQPLRRMSKKRRAELPSRKACCEAVRKRAGGRCEARLVGCWGEGADCHEIVPRNQGGSIADPENVMLLCRPCHDFTIQHPNEARKLGMLKDNY